MKVKITQQLISGIVATGQSYTISDDGRGAILGKMRLSPLKSPKRHKCTFTRLKPVWLSLF